MKLAKHTMFLLIITLPPHWIFGNESSSTVNTWNLPDLLRFAIDNSPTITKAKLEKQTASLEEIRAKSQFLPKLILDSSHGLKNQDPNPSINPEASSISLSLSQNLWNQGIDSKKLELSRLQKRKAEINYFQKRDEICLKITEEFYHYSLLVKSLEIQREQLNLLKKQVDLVSTEYLHGNRSRRDFLRFQAQSQRAELDLQKQITQIEKSRISLMEFAGFSSVNNDLQFTPEESPPPLLDLFKNPAELSNTYEEQIYSIEEQGIELSKLISIKSLTPTISLDLKSSLSSSDYWHSGKTLSEQENKSWGLFLNFQWTLWDGGNYHSQESLVNLNSDIQKTSLLQNKIQLSSEIQKLQKQFLQLKENFKRSEEFLILEKNNFLLIEGEYRQNKTTYLDFINGIKDLSDAKNRHWNNLFDLKQGIALYHYYRGSLFRYLLDDKSTSTEESTEEY